MFVIPADQHDQFSGFTENPPYRYTGLVRGAFGTKPAAHAKGDEAAYLQQRYLAFYPKPGSELAKALIQNIGATIQTEKQSSAWIP